MNIDYLYYFMDVAKTKSITRAAKLNFISPQGMSRAMNELEKGLGCQLLVRFSNKLELSEAGEKIEPYISRTIESYSRLSISPRANRIWNRTRAGRSCSNAKTSPCWRF